MKYSTKENGSLKKEDAKVLGRFIDKHFPKHDPTPEEVLDLAKNKKSPIHHLFNWDDTKAAHQWRLQQARQYISCLVVEIDNVKTKAYHNIVIEKERKYVRTDVAVKVPELWSQVLDRALMEIKYWKERYQSYKELQPIVEAITKVERKMENEKENSEGKRNGNKNSTSKSSISKNNTKRNDSTISP